MTRLQKCEILKSKGYTYDSDTGLIYTPRGKETLSKDKRGYKMLAVNNSNHKFHLWGHHFAYFMVYGNVDFIMLDHINKDKGDNRISNLRSVTSSENLHNKESIGCWFDTNRNKWATAIKINGVRKSLGRYNTKKEALEVYMSHKKHLIPLQNG
jgi:hypothetical protein